MSLARVEVEWHDSEGHSSWRLMREALAEVEQPLVHRSCGFLVAESDSGVLLALNYREGGADEAELVADTIRIPRAVVRKMRKLYTRGER